VTGEGRFDSVSLSSKVPAGVAEIAAASSVPCVVLAGDVTVSDEEARAAGVASTYSIMSMVGSVGEAFAQPAYWLEKLAAVAAREWSAKLHEAQALAADVPEPDPEVATSPNGGSASDPVRS
jgi:glycerate kinase